MQDIVYVHSKALCHEGISKHRTPRAAGSGWAEEPNEKQMESRELPALGFYYYL